MKCILKTNPATGNMRGATLHTTPIELLTILEALRIYEYERDNPIDKATARQMLEDLKNREVEVDRKTENSSEKPNNCEPQTETSTNSEKLQSGVEPKQTDMAEDIVESFGFKAESYRQAKAKTEPQTERRE